MSSASYRQYGTASGVRKSVPRDYKRQWLNNVAMESETSRSEPSPVSKKVSRCYTSADAGERPQRRSAYSPTSRREEIMSAMGDVMAYEEASQLLYLVSVGGDVRYRASVARAAMRMSRYRSYVRFTFLPISLS